MSDFIVPHDPAWQAAFVLERRAIVAALAPDPVTIHHIGSTAIPGILAKPIIDMLAEVSTLDALDAASARIEALGYEAMGAFGIAGRRYFRKSDPQGKRTHHLHAFAAGSPHIARHLAFRDYLIAHPKRAAAYSALKTRLVSDEASWETYADGKDPFVAATEAEALIWYQQSGSGKRDGHRLREMTSSALHRT